MIKIQKDFVAEIVRMKHKAGSLRMFKTMHALEAVVKQVGWEIAEHIEAEQLKEKP